MAEPYLPLYANDWRGDERLRAVSLAARGLWLEMLLLMNRAEPKGYLVVAQRRLGIKDYEAIAMHTVAPAAEVKRLLSELHGVGVFSIDDDGTIYSRRIVRDDQRRRTAQANGKRGGSPLLVRRDNPRGLTQPEKPTDEIGISQSTAGITHPDIPPSDKLKPSQVKLDTGEERAGAQDDSLLPIGDAPVRSPAMLFGEWFFATGRKLGDDVIPASWEIDPGPGGFAYKHLVASEALLATYDRDEIERRARNLMARKAVKGDGRLRVAANPTTLQQRWDWFDTAEAPNAKPAARKYDRHDISGGTDYAALVEQTKVRIYADN